MKKLSQFNKAFCEPFPFSEGELLLSRELYPTREEAAAAVFTEALDYDGPVAPAELREDWVRFKFPAEGCGEWRCPWWESGQEGKRGAKPVWVLG